MLCQYRYLAASFALCTTLALSVTARAATTVTPDAPPTGAETAAARRALPSDFRDAKQMSHHPLKFTVGHVDLNGDGRPDLIIHYADQGWCGSHGCLAYALLAGPVGYSPNAIMLVYFGQTMTVLDSSHHGMHDLRYDDATHVFRWTGTAYH
ncbi:MAG: hypothetical protein EPN46_03035 [Candidimonas sp.]|nr:MAG: hypothetical protein EPN77_19065 [Candidimonas sp.]TAM20325.1 MAG: hypothetical protein EPN62_16875 [Candidimonas sp.]TAM79890.1 MAG: hypothetical protein EPN46_03035 [Candidimonas sp.]